ncbi:SA1320 family protein, partial [Psychrobacillus psychrotolerans]
LNKENMLLLSNGIRDQVKGRITNVQSYLNNSVSIVLDESMQFSNRVTVLQQTFQTRFDEAAGDPLYNGISNTGTILKGCIDYLISLLDSAESKCRILNSILNSKPAEIIEFITSINIDVESLFAPAREYLNQLKDDVDNLVNGAQIIIQTHIPELFKGGKDMFVDAIVGELNAHYSIVHKNKEAVHNQLTNYETQVKDIATSMFNKDQNLGNSIQSGKSLADGVDTIQKTEIMNIDTSPYLTIGMKIKEIQVELAHKQITSLVTTIVHPIVNRIYTVALMIESAVSAIIFSVKAALNVGLYGNPISLLISIFTDYEEKVKAAVNNALVPLEEIETIAETVRMGSGSLSANLPEMLQNFMPYLDTAIFEPGKFDDVRLYNISTLAILDEMELLFNDIIFQLSGEKAKAIEATLEISKNVLNNIQLLREQVNRGTL